MNLPFSEIGLESSILSALAKLNITKPTEIQEKTIPLIFQKRDVIGISPTGTGKTLAYILPLFQNLSPDIAATGAIILVPTHEVAIQVVRVIEEISMHSGIGIRVAPIIGGVNLSRQIEKLKEKPHIIVGTSGRILELIRKRKITAHTVKTIVLDEGDKLLDDNNQEEVLSIIKTTLKERQILLFSASIHPKMMERAKNVLKEPALIRGDISIKIPDTIEHLYFVCEKRDKAEVLRKIIRITTPNKAIVFVHRSEDLNLLTEKLRYHGIEAQSIQGSDFKLERKNIMEHFRKGKLKVLIATDIAARGLDVDDITHIFNYDLPEESQNYLHRIGRTGRNGKRGVGISLVTKKELPFIRQYSKDLKITLHPMALYKGKIIDGKRSH